MLASVVTAAMKMMKLIYCRSGRGSADKFSEFVTHAIHRRFQFNQQRAGDGGLGSFLLSDQF